MFSIGMWEIVVIVLLALVFIKPEHLPELGKRAGKMYMDFMRAIGGVRDAVTAEPSGEGAKKADKRNEPGEGKT